jgi:hypothetical protein
MRTAYSAAALVLLCALPATGADKSDPRPFRGIRAYASVDEKSLTWRIGNDVVERRVQFDRESGGLKTIGVKSAGAKVMVPGTSEGEFQVVSADGKSRTVRLDKDWAYIWQMVGTPAHGGRKLTIHLWGVRSVGRSFEPGIRVGGLLRGLSRQPTLSGEEPHAHQPDRRACLGQRGDARPVGPRHG